MAQVITDLGERHVMFTDAAPPDTPPETPVNPNHDDDPGDCTDHEE